MPSSLLRGLSVGWLAFLAVAMGLPCPQGDPDAASRPVADVQVAAEAAEASSAWCGRSERPPARLSVPCPCGCDQPGVRPPGPGSGLPPRALAAAPAAIQGEVPWLAGERPTLLERPYGALEPVPILRAG